MRLRIDLAYDGEPFHGFARQPDLPTVQGVLEEALTKVLGQPVGLTCAGRTDRGVHASRQVLHFDVDDTVERAERVLPDLDDLAERLDRMAGSAITIWGIRTVDEEFDARFSARERHYRYRIVDAPKMHPLERYAAWHVPGPLDVEAMRAAAEHLLGEHDFAAFCRKPGDGHTVRRLDEITLRRVASSGLTVCLRAPAFCHQQVRSIVGCLVEVGRGRQRPDWVREVLESRDRSRGAPVAPPEGLVLEDVVYPDPGTT